MFHIIRQNTINALNLLHIFHSCSLSNFSQIVCACTFSNVCIAGDGIFSGRKSRRIESTKVEELIRSSDISSFLSSVTTSMTLLIHLDTTHHRNTVNVDLSRASLQSAIHRWIIAWNVGHFIKSIINTRHGYRFIYKQHFFLFHSLVESTIVSLKNENMPYKDYTTIGELRSGGTSRVYRVRDNDTGEIRAMKVTSFKEIQKVVWLNEIQMLQKLQYVRGVVKMYEFGELEDGNKELFGYAVLELCDEDLFEKPIIVSEQKTIFLFLYNILTQLHTMGYCYCDLKLENILRKGKGFRLCDFSSCQPIGTLTNVMYGTPHIIAPEILRSSESKKDYFYDEKIDTWGLGCILFEVLTGEQFDRSVYNDRIEIIKDPYFKPILQLCLEENQLARIRIWELSKKISDLFETKMKLSTVTSESGQQQKMESHERGKNLTMSVPHHEHVSLHGQNFPEIQQDHLTAVVDLPILKPRHPVVSVVRKPATERHLKQATERNVPFRAGTVLTQKLKKLDLLKKRVTMNQ